MRSTRITGTCSCGTAGDRALAGAYRLGLTDDIRRERGAGGLYTQTLFHYDERLLDRLSPAIELGRSFVRAEYQRDYAPLLLLWKGIGRFVVAHPRYRRLFGPVTISQDYSSASKHLLMAFLEANRRLPDLARLVAPRNPPREARRRDEGVVAGRTAADLDEADALVADIEADGRGLPVLLRQYPETERPPSWLERRSPLRARPRRPDARRSRGRAAPAPVPVSGQGRRRRVPRRARR